MEDSRSPNVHEDQSGTANPPPPQFEHPNTLKQSEYITINIEMVNSDYHSSSIHNNSNTLVGGGETHSQVATTTPPFPIPAAQFQIYTGILYLVYAAALLYLFPTLIALVGIKFQNKANSPFETHSLFANMAVLSYIIGILMPIALFYLKARLARKIQPPIYYRILQSVLCFWSLLAPLSLVLVLFLPHGLGFIGYLIIFILFVVVVACSFSNYICKEDASNLEAHTSNETLSHSTLTITEE